MLSVIALVCVTSIALSVYNCSVCVMSGRTSRQVLIWMTEVTQIMIRCQTLSILQTGTGYWLSAMIHYGVGQKNLLYSRRLSLLLVITDVIIACVKNLKHCQIFTFHMRRSRDEMYSGHRHLCACLSVHPLPHSHTTALSWIQLGRMVGVLSSCALLGGFAIGARVSLLWQHTCV